MVDEIKKDDKKDGRGGARPGAGRKPKLRDDARSLFYAAVDAQWDDIIAKLIELISKGDKDVLKMVIEQRIGRAPQSLELTGKNGGSIVIEVAKEIAEKNNLDVPHPDTISGSQGHA